MCRRGWQKWSVFSVTMCPVRNPITKKEGQSGHWVQRDGWATAHLLITIQLRMLGFQRWLSSQGDTKYMATP